MGGGAVTEPDGGYEDDWDDDEPADQDGKP